MKYIFFFLLINSITYSQEFMHWKFLENNKTDRIRTKTVWQYGISDSTDFKSKTLFSYHENNIDGRLIALRMYSKDTNYYSYDSIGIRRKVISQKLIKFNSKKIIKYSKTGKKVYEYQPKVISKGSQPGIFSYERFYFYDSLDRQIKMIVSPSREKFNWHDTIINLTLYNRCNKDSMRQHYVGGILKTETRYYYNINSNCIKRIFCKYENTPICDTTFTDYNEKGQKIHMIQQWHRNNDTKTYIDERSWDYDKKGRMIMASDNVSICRWSYNKQGYVIEAKRYDKKDNQLKFFVKYEYTFWTKKEIRTRKRTLRQLIN